MPVKIAIHEHDPFILSYDTDLYIGQDYYEISEEDFQKLNAGYKAFTEYQELLCKIENTYTRHEGTF